MYIKAVVDCIVIYALIKSVTKHISIKAPIKFDLHAKKLKPTNIYMWHWKILIIFLVRILFNVSHKGLFKQVMCH